MAKFEVVKIVIPLTGRPTFNLKIPVGGVILTFRSRTGEPVIYVAADPKAKLEVRKFRILSTAIPINADENLHYIGTIEWGSEGWHLFEFLTPA